MSKQDQASPATVLFVGAVALAAGLYFMLVGFGVAPAPGRTNAPRWLVFACGLAFALGGLGVILPRAAGLDATGHELPATSPRWLQVAQYLLGLAIFACFGAIGSWIAFGPGPRTFTGTIAVGAILGRIAFGIGAVIIWLGLIGFAVSGARRLFGRARRAA
jgi:hypothetical protein